MKNIVKSGGLTLGIALALIFISTLKINNTSSANRALAVVKSTPAIADLPNTTDGKIFQKIINYGTAKYLERQSMGTIVQTVAHQLLNAEYKAGLLDRSVQETLVISLQQFDCLLFIENVRRSPIILLKKITVIKHIQKK